MNEQRCSVGDLFGRRYVYSDEIWTWDTVSVSVWVHHWSSACQVFWQ